MSAGSRHIPVLLDEVIEALAIRQDGIYVDGTFGRGGHARAVFEIGKFERPRAGGFDLAAGFGFSQGEMFGAPRFFDRQDVEEFEGLAEGFPGGVGIYHSMTALA